MTESLNKIPLESQLIKPGVHSLKFINKNDELRCITGVGRSTKPFDIIKIFPNENLVIVKKHSDKKPALYLINYQTGKSVIDYVLGLSKIIYSDKIFYLNKINNFGGPCNHFIKIQSGKNETIVYNAPNGETFDFNDEFVNAIPTPIFNSNINKNKVKSANKKPELISIPIPKDKRIIEKNYKLKKFIDSDSSKFIINIKGTKKLGSITYNEISLNGKSFFQNHELADMPFSVLDGSVLVIPDIYENKNIWHLYDSNLRGRPFIQPDSFGHPVYVIGIQQATDSVILTMSNKSYIQMNLKKYKKLSMRRFKIEKQKNMGGVILETQNPEQYIKIEKQKREIISARRYKNGKQH